MNSETLVNNNRAVTRWAVWTVPLAFFYTFIFSPLISFSSRGMGSALNDSVTEGSLTNKLFWILLSSFAGFMLWEAGKKNRIRFSYPMVLLLAYMVLASMSCFWSDVPAICIRRTLLQILVIFSLVTPFLMGIKSEEIFNKVCWVFAAVILLNTILIPVLHIPSFGYTGIYPQKNGMGQVAVISFFFSIYAATKANGFKRILFCVFSILAVLLSVASHSKTSLALLILIPLFSWILVSVFRIQDSLKRVTTLIFCSILVAVIVSIGLIKSYDIYDLSYLIYHDRTFTGRTAIWKFAEHYIQQSPIIGYGYGSFWDVGNASRAIGTGFISTIFQAHNGYIDIVLELGYIGLFLAICYIVSIFLSITHIAIRDKITGILLLSCFLFVILNNTMESSLFRNYVPLWVVFLLCISASFEAKGLPGKAGQPDSASLA